MKHVLSSFQAKEILKKFEDQVESEMIYNEPELLIKEEVMEQDNDFTEGNYENYMESYDIPDEGYLDPLEDVKPMMKAKSKDVQCYKCSEIMDYDLIENHLKLIHNALVKEDYGPVRKYQCDKCFRALNNMDRHNCPKSRKKPIKKEPKKKVVKKKKAVRRASQAAFEAYVAKFKTKIICKFCSIEVKYCAMSAHFKECHSDIKEPWLCDHCEASFDERQKLNYHTKVYHEKNYTHFCSVCGKGFFGMVQAAMHEEKAHNKDNEKTFTCEQCGFSTIGIKKYNNHLKMIHGQVSSDSHTCEICGKTFTNMSNYKQHRKIVHPTKSELEEIPAKCDKCCQQFKTSNELNTHLTECLDQPLKNLGCVICNEGPYHSAIALRKHAAEEHEMNIFICDKCDAVFEKNEAYKNHRSNKHGNNTKNNQAKCSKCDKMCRNKDALQYHMLKEHGDDNCAHYNCQQCDKKFKRLYQMREHVNAIHTMETLYHCQLCDFTTYRKSSVGEHSRIVHEKRKPNKCDKCTSAFYYKRDLANHITRHHPSSE